jgi:hypothetical protein
MNDELMPTVIECDATPAPANHPDAFLVFDWDPTGSGGESA